MSDRDTAGDAPIDTPAGATNRAAIPAAPRMVSSDVLLRGETQLAILHEQTLYYLRRTRFGKLILTK